MTNTRENEHEEILRTSVRINSIFTVLDNCGLFRDNITNFSYHVIENQYSNFMTVEEFFALSNEQFKELVSRSDSIASVIEKFPDIHFQEDFIYENSDEILRLSLDVAKHHDSDELQCTDETLK